MRGGAGLHTQAWPEEASMDKMLVSKISTVAARLAIACGLLLACSPAWAEDEAKCTNKTLQGDYGFHIEGLILSLPTTNVPPGGIPIRGVAMSHFDGKGIMTQVDYVVRGGTPPAIPWTPGTATYTVNPNCTGTWTLIVTGSPQPPVTVSFVVNDNGKEIRTVVQANAVTSIGRKID
jgi:hypothetical protein